MLDEPLAIMAAAHFFNMEMPWSDSHFLRDGLSTSDSSTRGVAFKHFSTVMTRSIFTSLSSLSHLIFFISYLHMPFPYFGSYLSYLHVLSAIPVLISYLLSCT